MIITNASQPKSDSLSFLKPSAEKFWCLKRKNSHKTNNKPIAEKIASMNSIHDEPDKILSMLSFGFSALITPSGKAKKICENIYAATDTKIAGTGPHILISFADLIEVLPDSTASICVSTLLTGFGLRCVLFVLGEDIRLC